MSTPAGRAEDTYTVILTEGKDGWICAQIAEMPEAISQGHTPQEARANVAEALAEAIRWRRADGEPLPKDGAVRVESLRLTG